jgi:hypothetical protein
MLLLACTSAPIKIVESLPVEKEDSSALVGDSLESIPKGTGPESCSELYDPLILQEFSIEILPNDWSDLLEDYSRGQKNYHPATLTWGGEDHAAPYDVQIRLKGNPDFSWLTEKLQFVVSFNETDPEARFQGVRKLALDASWYEPTHLKDRLAWSIMQRVEALPAACASSARLTINGEYYGLYTSIEYFDHEYLERAFGKEAATGGLYKYGTELVANEDTANNAKISAFWRASTAEVLAETGNIEQWLLAWAAESVLGDDDGYWCCAHNFYLYDHPTQGILFLPWDMDDSFELVPTTTDPITGYPGGQEMGLFQQEAFITVLEKPEYQAGYLEAVKQLTEAMNPALTIPELEEWDALIKNSAEEDPSRSYSLEEREQALARLKSWLVARYAALQSWSACAEGSVEDKDGDGYPVCQDADDGNIEVSPAQLEVCDGLDNDSDGWMDDVVGCDCLRHGIDGREFLFCVAGRSWAEAEANCSENGGTLGSVSTTNDYYLTYFYTWPHRDPWWLADSNGESGGCKTWDPREFNFGAAACEEKLSSICYLP